MIKNEKGSTLMLVLITFSVVLILGLSLLTKSLYAQNQSVQEVSDQKAYYLAKSALDATITYMENNTLSSDTTGMIQKVKEGNAQIATYNKGEEGKAEVKLSKESDTTLLVESVGYYRNSQKKISAEIEIIPGVSAGSGAALTALGGTTYINNITIEGDIYTYDDVRVTNSIIQDTLYNIGNEGVNIQENSKLNTVKVEKDRGNFYIQRNSQIEELSIIIHSSDSYNAVTIENSKIPTIHAWVNGNVWLNGPSGIKRLQLQAKNICISDTTFVEGENIVLAQAVDKGNDTLSIDRSRGIKTLVASDFNKLQITYNWIGDKINTIYTEMPVSIDPETFLIPNIPESLKKQLQQLPISIKSDVEEKKNSSVIDWRVPEGFEVRMENMWGKYIEYERDDIRLIYVKPGDNYGIVVEEGNELPPSTHSTNLYKIPRDSDKIYVFCGENYVELKFSNTEEMKNIHVYTPDYRCIINAPSKLFTGSIVANAITLNGIQASDNVFQYIPLPGTEGGSGTGGSTNESYKFSKYKG